MFLSNWNMFRSTINKRKINRRNNNYKYNCANIYSNRNNCKFSITF